MGCSLVFKSDSYVMRISACLLLHGISVKNLSLGAPDEKEDACQSSSVSKEGGRSTQEKEEYPSSVHSTGPQASPLSHPPRTCAPGTGGGEAQIRFLKSFNS